jgi:hypothetical protein
MFLSRFMPCEACGASVDRSTARPHDCDPERLADYVMFGLREPVAHFESHLRHFLGTPTGRFEAWLAERHVRGAGPAPLTPDEDD